MLIKVAGCIALCLGMLFGLFLTFTVEEFTWIALSIDDDGVTNQRAEAFRSTAIMEETGSKPSLLDEAWEAWKDRRYDDADLAFRGCIEQEQEPVLKAKCKAARGESLLTRNLSIATGLLEEAAEVGDADAQYMLGVVYGSTHSVGDDLQKKEALAVLHLYAASTSAHPGALMAMGYRHYYGYGVPQSCQAAALNYIDVAKRIASVYSEGIPKAVELIRLNLNHKDRKGTSSNQKDLYVQIALGGDVTVATAIGKRFLLGGDNFKQDYAKAQHYLQLGANGKNPSAMALLGYMHSLGLGMPVDHEKAFSLFRSAANLGDPIGHNGMGYMYFTGLASQPPRKDLRKAFTHFNQSAHGGSSDGMFNLGSMYLTGTGVDRNFGKAVSSYTQAISRGHTPALYSLAVMHLNGIGTMRDCDVAVDLLKKVCERGEWASNTLNDAHEFAEKSPEHAVIMFMKLAEAGHEVAQMNAAHLFDSDLATVLYLGDADDAGTSGDDAGRGNQNAASAWHHRKTMAQRYYELSAEQGSASSELRLGDYSYSGWGLVAKFKESSEPDMVDIFSAENGGSEQEGMKLRSLYTSNQVELFPQSVDYQTAMARYEKTAEMTVTIDWMQSFVARGSFNLGFMHQFGYGVPMDLHLARRYYKRSQEIDPSSTGLHGPVFFMLVFVGAHEVFLRFPSWSVFIHRFFADIRVHAAITKVVVVGFILFLRKTVDRRVQRRLRTREVAGAANQVETQRAS